MTNESVAACVQSSRARIPRSDDMIDDESEWIIIIFIMTDGATAAGQYASLVIRNTLSPQIELLSMIIYRIAKFKSAESAYCNTSTSKAQW